jgi:hypothetical protein
MKGLVWIAIKPDGIKGSIWEEIDDEKVNINIEAFEGEFCRIKKGENNSNNSMVGS